MNAPPAVSRRAWLLAGAAVVIDAAQAAGPATAGAHGREAIVRRDAWLFGGPVGLHLAPAADAALGAGTVADLASIHRRWNAWKPGEVTALNEAFAQGRSARVAPTLAALIRGAHQLERRSRGHFNAGIGGLVGAWGFHADRLAPGPRPSASRLARWREARPGLGQLEWRGLEVRSTNHALRLDFGGYAKGVAIDLALDRLAAHGARDALLDLGGNLAAMGRAAARPWRVGIRDPHGAGLIATLELAGREAVVTSGTYERWREIDGVRAGHVIDPARGDPAHGLASVTVVHPCAALADGAATALLVAGASGWRTLAERLGVAQVLVVDDRGRREATAALAPRLRFVG